MTYRDGEKPDFEDVPSDEAEGSYDDVASDIGSLGEMSFAEEETKSRFTSYSMSSSVVTRNAGLTLLDDRFEKVCAERLLFIIYLLTYSLAVPSGVQGREQSTPSIF